MLNTRELEYNTPWMRVGGVSIARSDVLVAVLLFFTLFVGGYFRAMSNNWDDFVRFHPDERYLAQVATRLDTSFAYSPTCEVWDTACQDRLTQINACMAKYPDTNGAGPFFDTNCSLWHPENSSYPHYVYGTLPLFMTRLAGQFWADTTGNSVWTSYDGIFHVWRTLSAIAETLTIFLTFLIGLKLHDKWVGLLGAMLYAFAVFPIQQAHFGTTDAITTMFVVTAIYFAARTLDSGSMWDYAGFGMALGAAVASRVNVAPLAVIIVAVAVVRAMPAFDFRMGWPRRNDMLTTHFGGLVLAAVMSLIVFRLGQPYAFQGPTIFGILPDQRYIETLSHAQYTVSGELESPPNWQWVNRTGYLFPWSNMVLWGMGIALGLAAWISWVWSGWRLLRAQMGATRNLILFLWVLVYFLFAGNLWVMSMRYYLPMYAPLALLAAWGLIELIRRTSLPSIALWRKVTTRGLLVGVLAFTILWALMFTNVYRHMATFTQASHWVWENVPGDFAMRIENSDGEDLPLINIALPNRYVPDSTLIEEHMVTQASRLVVGIPQRIEFIAPASGAVSEVFSPHIGDPFASGSQKLIRVEISQVGSEETLAQAELTDVFKTDEHVLGSAYTLQLDQPLEVEQGQHYIFTVTLVQGDNLMTSGSVMFVESRWEEVMPAKVCQLPGGITLADDPTSGLNTFSNCNGRSVWDGLLNGHVMETHWEDEPTKRDRFQTILDQTEYILIPTNRRYDTQSRIPVRWPMTNRFYDALFSGELGFELIAQFQETFELGPLKVSDQYLPTYSGPGWLNEFESEEAFSVYDHPVVFIFKKDASYSSENTASILNVPLTRVGGGFPGYTTSVIANAITWSSLQADEVPTALEFTQETQDIQETGGTWSDRFDTDSIFNANQGVTVVLWWLTIILFGWAMWPVLFFAFPALADRGYGFAKFVGILFVAWVAWLLASMRLAMWSRAGILVILILLALFSAWLVSRNQSKFVAYIKRRWRLLLMIEALSLLMYLVFIGVRMTNPDLWHVAYGGEKPMDFAYFNAVLRSTIFPPIDPWFAGGYINYYYFGYVIVGTPTLLLGVVPSLAYNLIVPTLFSLTGISAFSAAFSVVNGWRGRSAETENNDLENELLMEAHPPPPQRSTLGNPWVAGVMALLLAVVLGNLGTVNEMGIAIARLGGHQQPTGLGDYLIDQYVEEHGFQPNELDLAQIYQRAADGRLTDRISYEWDNFSSLVGGLFAGMRDLMEGQPVYISPERWFWGPTRVIAEAAQSGDGAINEMPYFTFLYGDLHAHMISMPMMLFVIAFIYNELMTAGRDRRNFWSRYGALFIGALAVGMFQATNTWDYPTFMILTLAGLAYAWWLMWGRITRWSLMSAAGRIGSFLVIQFAVAIPYTYWFSSALTSFKIWEGKKTPFWAYFTIHGLFLFLIVTLLMWETARWMRSVKVGDLRGKGTLVASLMGGILMIVAGSLVLAALEYQVALIVLPLIGWIALLFFRPGQARPMQYILVLAGLGLAITLGTEIVTLTNDNGRQNTIFKFYIQVWLLFSVVGGAGFAWMIKNSIGWAAKIALPFYVILGTLLFIAALYPIQATRGKAEFRFTHDVPLTLDGMDYMVYAQHYEPGMNDAIDLSHDYNVIRWLQENVVGSPVIMEAQSEGSLYRWGGRISINTGLPSVMGWDYHQRQQRSLDPLPTLVNYRAANVNAFYSTATIPETLDIMDFYDVTYIVLSNYERERYGLPEDTNFTIEDPLNKFDDLIEREILTVAFDDGVARILEVNKDMLRAYQVAHAVATMDLNR